MTRSRWRAGLALLVLALSGCRPVVLFVGDPALKASIPDANAFAGELDTAVRDTGYRAFVVWPDADGLDAVDVDAVLRSRDESVVVLSPYLSLLAPEIAPDFPDTLFIAYYGSKPVPNLRWVDFDAISAMREAGRSLAAWTFDAAGREAFGLVSRADRRLSEEADAFLAGYEDEAGIPLATTEFPRAPTRDEIRAAVDGFLSEREQAAAVLLGAQSGVAFDLLRSEDTMLVVRDAIVGAASDRVLVTVYDDLARGAVTALRSDREAEVVVDASLEVSDAVRR